MPRRRGCRRSRCCRLPTRPATPPTRVSPTGRRGAAGLEPAGLPDASSTGMPSVAVLPFANVTGDPDHEYFAYGLTEDIIRLPGTTRSPRVPTRPPRAPSRRPDSGVAADTGGPLGTNRWLRVLTRPATVAYRGKDVDAREVGAALGVRYL